MAVIKNTQTYNQYKEHCDDYECKNNRLISSDTDLCKTQWISTTVYSRATLRLYIEARKLVILKTQDTLSELLLCYLYLLCPAHLPHLHDRFDEYPEMCFQGPEILPRFDISTIYTSISEKTHMLNSVSKISTFLHTKDTA